MLKYKLESKSKKCYLRQFRRLVSPKNGYTRKKVWTMFKVNGKTSERRHWLRSGVFIVICNIFHTFLQCFYCWLWTDNCFLGEHFVQMCLFSILQHLFGPRVQYGMILPSTNQMADILYVSDNEQCWNKWKYW